MKNRLYLKEIITSDIDDRVMSWFEDKDLMKYYTSSKKKIGKADLLRSIKDSEINNVYTFGIFFKDNDVLIGTIKIGPIHQVHKTADLVALIGDRNYLGKGLSVDAIKLANEIAFTKFDVRRLQGGMYVSNIASIKAYTRANWMIDGLHKGFYYLNNKNEDRITVCCLNPKYFTDLEINTIKNQESRYVY
ncbi:GNAT family N-acetyltransferase [Bizionia sp.]|uniref:GNAT family N-acetyltransferase n=1 Tax=Bizionia sp. TaxID=1954480 RepID=UPI003A8E05E2